ncbi:ammonium transporter Rh type B isoform X2 [Nematostella vectensis]|uniref:ammonium transporter Rh type B isoform X2 n=1 Tax=Nematostella vectensis TaxID=45351 RepID=UPI002077830E|nr:ammonium transporter Rh type B isoform X2 [Nematostella vectensis]
MAGEPTFTVICLSFQILLIVLYAPLVDYGDHALPPHKSSDNSFYWQNRLPGSGILTINHSYTTELKQLAKNDITVYYPMFQDVHVMVYIGFGFLMTFLRKYSFGALGYNFFIAALVCQWATIVTGVFNQIIGEGHSHIKVNVQTMTGAEFTAAAVLISFGAVLGKVSRLQLLVIGFFEVIFFAINEFIAVHYFKIADAGGSIIIHAFGAYFGIAIARVLYEKANDESDKEGSVYHSDLFSMLGTLFLWLFWPSFNSILVAPDYVAQHRAVINTYYSLAAACVVTFALSPLFQKGYKLNMVHIQNATLAGGVAIGTASNMVIYPWGALLVGSISGTISTLGYAYLTPFLTNYLKTHDTCGVNNLHGMPGIIGAIVGAVAAANADPDTYGYDGLYNVWSAVAPKVNSTEYVKLKNMNVQFTPGDGRSYKEQGGYQMAALFLAIAIALVGGAITGFICKVSIFEPPAGYQLYDDKDFWEVPSESIHVVIKDTSSGEQGHEEHKF